MRWAAACSAILFDLDGTLVDSTDAVLRGWQAWARGQGVATAELIDLVIGRSAREIIASLLPDLPEALLQHHIRQVLEIQALDPDPARPVRGALELVEHLADHQWAVVTACSAAMVAARLKAGGLPEPRTTVTDEDVSAGKPDPEGYLLALRRMNRAAGEAVAVEDSPAGIAAAKAAGLRTVAVTHTHPREHLRAADVVVDGLDQLAIAVSAGGLTITAKPAAR